MGGGGGADGGARVGGGGGSGAPPRPIWRLLAMRNVSLNGDAEEKRVATEHEPGCYAQALAAVAAARQKARLVLAAAAARRGELPWCQGEACEPAVAAAFCITGTGTAFPRMKYPRSP